MPIFEYHCPECSRTSEKISSRPTDSIVCPECGAIAVRTVSTFSAGSTGSGGSCQSPPGSGFG